MSWRHFVVTASLTLEGDDLMTYESLGHQLPQWRRIGTDIYETKDSSNNVWTLWWFSPGYLLKQDSSRQMPLPITSANGLYYALDTAGAHVLAASKGTSS